MGEPSGPRESLVLKGFLEPSAAYRILADGTAGEAVASAPAPRGPALTLGGFLIALVGGGCLGKVFLGSLWLALGAGSGAALLAFSVWFDHSFLRIPLLLSASAAATASLVVAARERNLRRALEARNGCVLATPSEKRRNLLVVALSLAAFAFVAAELALHSGHGDKFLRDHGWLGADKHPV